ncbi:MAG: hypothetical protein ACI4VW_06360 [Acutalibacteraceae bacterium]
MNFILNEKEYVENALTTGDYADDIHKTLVLLAQYYYQYCGFRKVKITNLLLDFLVKNYAPYVQNKRQWAATCEKIARKTGGKTLLEISGVWITASELETIAKIENKTLARLAFTMLCIAKLNNAKNTKNNNWVNLDSKDIFNAARVTGSRTQRDLKIADLLDLGLIELPKNNSKLNIRVAFLDDDSEKKIFVSDFRELGNLYRYEIEKNNRIYKCELCGKYNRNGKLCADCQKTQENKKLEIKHIETTNEIICIDCGKSFRIEKRIKNKCRCDECQKEYRKLQDRLRKNVFSTRLNPLQSLKV